MFRDSARLRNEGLSPRVRGNHSQQAENRLKMRSIPACAGEPICAGIIDKS